MTSPEGLPLNIIHYKVAQHGGQGFDTGVKVAEADIEEARTAIDPNVAPGFVPDLIANQLKAKFRHQIAAAVQAKGPDYNEPDWLIQDGELGEAIRRVAGQQS